MVSLIIDILWILLAVVLLAGMFLAVLWVLRVNGWTIPRPVDKFGLLIISLLALVTLVIGGASPMCGLHLLR